LSGRSPSLRSNDELPLACIIHEYLLNSFLDGTRLPNKATAA
jgi:two-component sensor histidine kinase